MTYKQRWIRSVLALLILIVAVWAAWKGIAQDRQEIEVVVVLKSTDLEFWQVLMDGVEEAAKEFGVRVQVWGSEAETDVEGQIALVERAIMQKPDAIVLAANDYERLVPVSEQVKKNGIKLIIVDSGIHSDVPLSIVATDNINAGIQAGQAMLRHIDGPARIAMISYVRHAGSLIDREKGVRQVLEAEPGIELLETFDALGSGENAYHTIKQLLETDEGVNAVVGLNEPTAVGAGRAIRDLGLKDKVKLIGFDSSVDEIKLLEEGTMQATVIQRPFQMGYLSVKTAVEAVKGKKVPERLDTGSLLITKENMYEEESQKLLFPFIGK